MLIPKKPISALRRTSSWLGGLFSRSSSAAMAGSSARAKSRAAERGSSWSGVSLKSMLLSGGVRHASSQKFRLFDKVGERGHETAAIGSVDRDRKSVVSGKSVSVSVDLGGGR